MLVLINNRNLHFIRGKHRNLRARQRARIPRGTLTVHFYVPRGKSRAARPLRQQWQRMRQILVQRHVGQVVRHGQCVFLHAHAPLHIPNSYYM